MLEIGDKILIYKKDKLSFNPHGKMDKYIGRILTVKKLNLFSVNVTEDGGYWNWFPECYINVTELLQSNITEKEIINQLFGKGE